jgi:hypothetical protein
MKYVQKNDVVIRSVVGENLLIPLQGCTNKVYTLNDAGCRLWNMIAFPHTEDELAENLVEQYRISGDTARPDVKAFLDNMVRMGLVEKHE